MQIKRKNKAIFSSMSAARLIMRVRSDQGVDLYMYDGSRPVRSNQGVDLYRYDVSRPGRVRRAWKMSQPVKEDAAPLSARGDCRRKKLCSPCRLLPFCRSES
ncbi:hypothetical protein PoB_006901700 [Plakobranchus ocellatus]|uniref:Uncharacterized protein n=1 Tax=Plakobranchus ocellatus TaxID=259542 RepID=A0AAV4DE40_9GAST|nr:hypothetical protein PoB_006901700 [Plakobranchus ocellatus]